MPKRGQRLPYKLKTTWSDAAIRPFTQALSTESELRYRLVEQLRVANYRDDINAQFEMWKADDPSYVAPVYERCPECRTRWATEDPVDGGPLLCLPCYDTLEGDRY